MVFCFVTFILGSRDLQETSSVQSRFGVASRPTAGSAFPRQAEKTPLPRAQEREVHPGILLKRRPPYFLK